jgi:hypothetical protein
LVLTYREGDRTMGRGLSDLQKRVLIYARHCGVPTLIMGSGLIDCCAPWFDILPSRGKQQLRKWLLPESKHWAPSDRVIVSRALKRLERRKLIEPFLGVTSRLNKRRAAGIILTPAGGKAAKFLDQESLDHPPPEPSQAAPLACGEPLIGQLVSPLEWLMGDRKLPHRRKAKRRRRKAKR